MIWRWLGTARFEILLRGRIQSLVFLAAVGFVSLLLAAESSLLGIVASFATPAQGHWLLAVDSEDPQLQYHLAQVYNNNGSAESVRRLRRAVELSPYSRLYWSRLGSACESLNDSQCADGAWERLLQLCPMVPLYHWDAAQSDLRAKLLDESVAQFRRLLELDPTFAPGTWSSLRAVLGPDVIFQKMLASSADSELKVSYVDFLSDQEENDAAYRAWKLTAATPRSFPFAPRSSAQRYIERLIDRGRIDEAAEVWQDLERLGIVSKPRSEGSGNLVFNGGFEQFPLNAGFDWRWGGLTYLAIDFSAPGAYHGAHCLRIEFTVSRNNEYEPVCQIVPVLPNHAYQLEAYVRSENITSDTGPTLRVSDTQQPGFRDVVSDTTVGTTPWHPVHLYFSTGPKSRAVRLSIWRPRGRTFPTEITGSFWLDAVTLESGDSAASPDPSSHLSAKGGQQ
jgi:tetratricopeptide (TPR) repeat protein